MNMQVNRLTPGDYAERFSQPVNRRLQEEAEQPKANARTEQAERTEKTAQAGQSYLRENPTPDPREGVVMSLSAREEEGSVRKVEDVAAQPATSRDAIEAVQERRDDRKEAEAAQQMSPAAQPASGRDAIEAVQERRDEKKEADAVQEASPAAQPATQPASGRDAIAAVQERREERSEEAQAQEMNPAAQPATSREAIEAAGEKEEETSAPQTIDIRMNNANMSIERMRDEMMQRQAQQAMNPLQAA